MRYVLFKPLAEPAAPLRIGALHPNGSDVADVTAALGQDAGSAPVSSMRVFLTLGPAACRAAAERALADAKYHHPLAAVNLRAPIYDPCVFYRRGCCCGCARARALGRPLATPALLPPPPPPPRTYPAGRS